MKLNNVNGAGFMTFDIFSDIQWLRHCFSTRLGGVSTGPRESLNLAFRDDLEENVRENYKRLCDAAGFSFTGITFSSQEHGTNLRLISNEDRGKGFWKEKDYVNIDGIITSEKNIALTTFYGDCVPLFFCDVDKKIVGMSHAGWRGTVDKIAEKTVDFLTGELSCSKENLLFGIGPSISKCCFEVDYPVYNEFVEKLDFAREYIEDKGNGKYHIDLKSINRHILVQSGISPENIEVSSNCTKCEDNLFYSHRRSGKDRGSMVGIMEII